MAQASQYVQYQVWLQARGSPCTHPLGEATLFGNVGVDVLQVWMDHAVVLEWNEQEAFYLPCPCFPPHTSSAAVASMWGLRHKLAQIAMTETQWHLRPQNPANPVVFFGACMAAAHINIIHSRPK